MPAPPPLPALAFLGFGEAGKAFWAGLRAETPALSARARDIKTDAPGTAAAMRADYAACGVEGVAATADLADAGIVFSLVTADQAGPAAAALASAALDGLLYLDGNSCAPETKRRAAAVIEAAGGRYVDLAVMAPVHPAQLRTPCLLSGPHAGAAAERLSALGMKVEVDAGPVGAASTRKMVRSVMIKGLEALVAECLLAARRAGVEAATLASLEASFPGFGWSTRAPYMLERVIAHGPRRAAEMREVAATLAGLGIAPRMSAATALVQDEIGALGLDAAAAGTGAGATGALLDAILAALETGRRQP